MCVIVVLLNEMFHVACFLILVWTKRPPFTELAITMVCYMKKAPGSNKGKGNEINLAEKNNSQALYS